MRGGMSMNAEQAFDVVMQVLSRVELGILKLPDVALLNQAMGKLSTIVKAAKSDVVEPVVPELKKEQK
jgi:hypothetical protein